MTTFISIDQQTVVFPVTAYTQSAYLDMLVRQHVQSGKTGGVRTDLTETDLRLAENMCRRHVFLNPWLVKNKPDGFDTLEEFIDFLLIPDWEEEEIDDYLDRYEGWPPAMIAEQEEEDRYLDQWFDDEIRKLESETYD